MRTVDNSQDILDSRDIIERIEELESELSQHIENTAEHFDDEDIRDDIYRGKFEPSDIRNMHTLIPLAKRESVIESLDDWIEWEASEFEELEALRKLVSEAEGSPDWEYGEILIRDSYFKTYAQDLAEDCGLLSDSQTWPGRCIDWWKAAEELQMDYFSVDFAGVEYWIRK